MTQEEHTPGRPLDEVYDTQRDVEQDPYGAWQAIQTLSAERDAIKAELARLRVLMEARDSFDRGEPSQPPETGVQKRAFIARHQKEKDT